MTKKLDFTDLRILEGLGDYGPRNFTDVARKLGMHGETLRKRLERLQSRFFLRTHVNVYHTFLGLKKAVVFAESVPGYEDLLLESLKQNDFWIFVSRCYGTFDGCIGIFTIPKDHCDEFEKFLEEMKQLGITKNVQIFWSTCFHYVHSRCNWYDPQSKTWKFKWDEWTEEIKNERTKLPYTLVDPKEFPIRGDKLDVLMLKELEKDATISFVDLAKILKISPQLARYHYQKHIIGRGLMESFEISAFHFDRTPSDVFFFIFRFDNPEKLAKFASSLLDKSFVRGLGKILGENALFGYLYLPRSEFRTFLNTLSKLVRDGFLESYRYVIQDMESSSRQTISYEYFKNKSWIYDHKRHIENLRKLVKNANIQTAM